MTHFTVNFDPLEAQYKDYVNLSKSGLITEQAVSKLKLSKPPPIGIANCQYLQPISKQGQLSPFKDFLPWYKIEEGVSTLESMHENIGFTSSKVLMFKRSAEDYQTWPTFVYLYL